MNIDWDKINAAIWRQKKAYLRPVHAIDPISLDDLVGIDAQKTALLENTRRFIDKLPANNALLWGARGTGKSSLVKAILNEYATEGLRIIQMERDGLADLPEIVDELREVKQRFIIYCDDFSFQATETSYVALKSILDGSIEQRPDNVLLYATSNRRHLLPEYMADNQNAILVEGELHYTDAVEERISLSDRFGLWLSFYQTDLQGYLRIVDSYFRDYQGDVAELHEAARLFSASRASRSGRTAQQFFNAYSQKNNN